MALERTPRYRKKLYIGTLVAVVLISIIEAFLTQRSLFQQSSDSRVINIAGRQRMLSQKLSKAALAVNTHAAERQERLQELSDAIALWSRSHEGLKNGDAELGLPGKNSSEITLMFAEIEPHYQAMLAAGRQILSSNQSRTADILPLLKTILANEVPFLKGMNEIVFQYEREAQGRVEKLENIQWLLLAIVLPMLLFLFLTIESVTKNLNSLIGKMQESGIQVTSSSTQIAASGKQLEATVTEQVASTNEVTATAQEIANNSRELMQTMEQVAQLVQATADATSSSQEDLQRMETTMSQLAEATTAIAAKLGLISEKANQINSVVTTITKVADRTNLLSLNAAIEAEKAGEFGAGFAVVAREIRRLADQTAVATLDIESMVKDMQTAVSAGVMSMDKFRQEVRQGVADVRNIIQQIQEAIAQVQSLTPRFEVVTQGMENQCISAEQIREAMEQLSEASLQTATVLRDTNHTLEQLHDAAQQLQII
ncbi:MAG: methyl-accepting chemotaxis protein [Hormoscilla sp.]